MNKLITAIEPFLAAVIILAGSSLAGWASFTNKHVVGIATVFCGILLAVNHVYKQFANDKPKASKKDK